MSSPGDEVERGSDLSVLPGDSLLSLGDLGSRHLIARTSKTDILARSIEQIALEATNFTELQSLIEGITRPYEELFVRHAKEQPKKAPEVTFDGRENLRVGGWEDNETTDNGLLTSRVRYGFERTKLGPKVEVAKVYIRSLHDADAELTVDFLDDNTISGVRLGWSVWNRWSTSSQPTQPYTLLKKWGGTELGEVIDTLIGPHALNQARGEQWLTFRLGQNPAITASREGYHYPAEEDKEGEWHFQTASDLQYHPGKNLFVRQHGLKDISETDNITALNPEEVVIILHQLLSLVPTLSLG